MSEEPLCAFQIGSFFFFFKSIDNRQLALDPFFIIRLRLQTEFYECSIVYEKAIGSNPFANESNGTNGTSEVPFCGNASSS
jgi:hypothetical protein